MIHNLAIILRSLETGGTEKQAVELARNIDKTKFLPRIITFYDRGELIQVAREAGINVSVLGKRGQFDLIGFAFKLRAELNAFKPTLVHSFLDSPNIILAISKLLGYRFGLIWGIRSSSMEISRYKKARQIGEYLETLLSRIPNKIVCNSHAGEASVIERGFPKNSCTVVHNGIDIKKFSMVKSYRISMRKKWNCSDKNLAIGMVARTDPKKDHKNFIDAARLASEKRKELIFILVTNKHDHIKPLIAASGIADKFRLLPQNTKVEEVYSGLDINTLSSAFGEGFPNVAAEGMAAQCPTVVTDTGDAAMIVGDNRLIVPPRNSIALSNAWLWLTDLSYEKRTQVGQDCQKRIASNFSIEKMTSKLVKIYEEVLHDVLK